MAELSRAEPARDEPSRAEPGRAGPSGAELIRAGPGRAGPGRAETAPDGPRTAPRRAGPGRDGPRRPRESNFSRPGRCNEIPKVLLGRSHTISIPSRHAMERPWIPFSFFASKNPL